MTDSEREAWIQSTGVLRVTLHGRDVEFRFPSSIYMQNLVGMIFRGEEYPLFPLQGYSPTTIVDVGANVGATAFYFHNAYPNAQIFGYEPSRENFRCFEENVRPFADKIHGFSYGLLDRDVEAPLFRGTSQTAQNSIIASSETTFTPSEQVQLVRVAREIADREWREISILKIDTEGCEVPILTEFLNAIPKIEFIYFEYHADNDRRLIDAMLADRFLMCHCKATTAHRGTAVYAAWDLIQQYPQLSSGSKSLVGANCKSKPSHQ